jgi:hypothetical protein
MFSLLLNAHLLQILAVLSFVCRCVYFFKNAIWICIKLGIDFCSPWLNIRQINLNLFSFSSHKKYVLNVELQTRFVESL